MIAFAKASRNAISTSLDALRNTAALPEPQHEPIPEGRKRNHFAWQRALQFEARAALIMGGVVIGNPTRRDLFFFQRRSLNVVPNMGAEHGRATFRLLFR